MEIDIAEGGDPPEGGVPGEPTLYTCPECHGVLRMLREGPIARFRCHTGHAVSAGSLLESIAEQREARLWDALRAEDEAAMLLEHMARHANEAGQPAEADRYRAEAEGARRRGAAIRELALARADAPLQ